MRKTLAERFWEKVDKETTPTGCWVWIAFRHPKNGYGRIIVNGRVEQAHRVSWRIALGEPGELQVLHKCDNPPCVRPDHLFLGTHQENMDDKVAKDRQTHIGAPTGAENGMAKLTGPCVEEIRAKYSDGLATQKELGRQFGVSRTTISLIVNNKRWRGK